jgi:hypothetical protein
VRAHRHLSLVEGDSSRHEARQRARHVLTLFDDLEAATHFGARLLGVAEIGDEHAAFGADDKRPVAAREVRQVANVGAVRDEQRVELLVAQRRY